MIDEDKTKEQLISELQELRGRLVELDSNKADQTSAELALQESKERYRAFFEEGPDGVVILNPETGRPIEFNNQVCQQLGYSREEFAQLHLTHIEVSETAEEIQAHLQKVVQEGRDDFETLQRTKEGEIRHVHVTARMINVGRRSFYHCIWRDITDRKRAVEALRQSEQKYRFIAENVRDVILSTDAYGNYTYVSPSHELILARGEEVVGQSVFEHIHPEDLDRVKTTFAKGLESGEEQKIEFRYQHPSKGYVWLEAVGKTYLNDRGYTGALVTSRDITERKQAEEVRREVEGKFSIAFHHAPVMAAITVLEDGTYLDVNNKFIEVLGLEREQVLGKTSVEVGWLKADDRKRLIEILKRDGKVSGVEVTSYARNGSPIECLYYCNLVNIGGVRRLLTMLLDVTERKRSEEERTLLATAVEQAEENVFITDHRRTILYINPAFERSSGYRLEDLKGKKLRTLRSARHDEAFYRNMKEVLDRGEVWMGVIINKGKDGSDFEVEATISPIRDASGAITHLVGAGRDMSLFRKLERELQQAQKMESVGRLAGGVAHDFNNMLGVIIGHADLAQLRIDSAQPAYTHLQEIQKAAHRSANLVHQLLAFARKQTINPKVLDINETVESMLKMVRRLIGEDIELLWKPGVGVWPVKVDPTQIDQILANLCVNARDAIAGVGKVMIETGNVSFDVTYDLEGAEVPPGDYVLLAVNDTGSGMEKQVLDKLFEPFFTTKEMGKGTGLGLATVYGIVKQNNGFIEVQSEPGRGTTFRIYLPRTDQLASEEHPSQHPKKNLTGTETILFVEDEDSLLKLGKTTLEHHGYLVLAARGPLEALDLAKSHSGAIDLLLTDVIMPAMNGRELAEKLSAFKPGLRFMFMSGYTSDVIAQHGVLDEGAHFLQKPFSVKNMVEKIREVLDT